MPTLAAFKQTRAPEREPEATLARLCQGSYLEPQECIFKSAQRMVDPGELEINKLTATRKIRTTKRLTCI